MVLKGLIIWSLPDSPTSSLTPLCHLFLTTFPITVLNHSHFVEKAKSTPTCVSLQILLLLSGTSFLAFLHLRIRQNSAWPSAPQRNSPVWFCCLSCEFVLTPILSMWCSVIYVEIYVEIISLLELLEDGDLYLGFLSDWKHSN
jgi:hypothetical protein